MPEGVELKLSVDTIKPLLVARKLVKVVPSGTGRYNATDPNGLVQFNKYLEQSVCQIVDVKTKGKFMYWTLTDDWYVFITFGMTGQLSPFQGNHPCFEFHLEEADQVKPFYFNDPRHFGTIQFVNGSHLLKKKLAELGWDPLQAGMDKKWINFIINSCSTKKKPIGQLLLEQKIFAGVGNYIRAEALYGAKISPWREASNLSKEEINVLCQSIVDVMQESYRHQGATIATYKDAYGAEGKYSSCFKVYGKAVDPLGNPIIKEETPEGRTIHWCPVMQI